MVKIGLDYGHGGQDCGAVYDRRKESDDVLALGLQIAKILRSCGLTVGESRTTDTFVSLQERSRLSNDREDDYLISIHRNAFKPEVACGVETYVHPDASDKATLLARAIQESLVGVGFIHRGVKQANFQVLRETRAPAVLVEVGFIDNAKDNLLFDSKRDAIAGAIVRGILEHVGLG